MATTLELDGMSEDEVLDAAGSCAETVWRAEVELLRIAHHWAVLHAPARLDPAHADLPGRERARQLGGDGTPQVTEFAAAELGARIGRSPYAAARLMADAQDLHHRHPQLWGRTQAGEVRASYARHVVARTRDLSRTEAAYVDAKVAQAAPEVARQREERAATARFAKTLRTEAHGMASFLIRADIATIDAIDAAVTAKAAELDTEASEATEDERRVQAALVLLAGPDTSIDVQLFVHTYADSTGRGDSEGIVRVEDHQPVTDTWVRTVLGPHARFTIRPVLDLAGQAPVDAYEIPDRHRQAVHLMTPADTFPFASCTSRRMQIDHTVPHDQGGRSGVGNYGPMTTTHHRIKTHGGWQVRQPWPGLYLWRDPHGAFYLVDHTGTRRLPGAPPRPVEIYRTPHRVEVALAA